MPVSNRGLAKLGIWFVLALVCAWLAFTTPISTDISLFLPNDSPDAKLLGELRQGPATRLLLVAIEGEPATATAISKHIAQGLPATGFFTRVNNGGQALDDASQEILFRYRYLLSPAITSEHFSTASLRDALQQRLRELASPLGGFSKQLLPSDPTGEIIRLSEGWQQAASQQPPKQFDVWFDTDSNRALLLIETKADGFDLDAQEKAVKAINDAFESAEIKSGEATLLISGPAQFALSSRSTIRSETQWLSMAASIMVMLLLIAVFRSFRLLLLGGLPLLSAILFAVAVVSVLFDGIHGITLAFGITLLGVVIDYPIHFFSHLRLPSAKASLDRIWPTLRLSAVTTALGYSAMLSTEFSGLAQLGVFAGSGLVAAVLVTRWLLPDLISQVDLTRKSSQPSFAKGGLVACLNPSPLLARIVFISIALLFLALLFIGPPLWQDDLAQLSPVPNSAIALDRDLRQALGAPETSQLLVLTAPNTEAALQQSEVLRTQLETWIAQDWLSGFDMAALYLPSQQLQRQRQTDLPNPNQLETQLAQALEGLTFKSGLFQPFLHDITASQHLEKLTINDLSTTPLAAKTNSLLFPSDDAWLALIPLAGVTQAEKIEADLASNPSVRYFNLKQASDRMITGFRQAAFTRLGIGGLLILLVLWFGTRTPKRLLAVATPVLLALLLTVAVLLTMGERLTLFHLISLLLVAGIGLDYSLFFSHPEGQLTDRLNTLRAVLVCSGSTLLVFGMLALSALPVLKAIGLTVAIGVCSSFVLALVIAQQVQIKT